MYFQRLGISFIKLCLGGMILTQKVVVEKKGCFSGCGTLIGIGVLLSLFTAFWPVILAIAVIAIICWFVFGYPKYKENNRKAKEELEIIEMERKNELDRRRIEAEKVQDKLKKSNEKKSDDNDWVDF